MKRAPRSLQHHVLYRKYNGQDSEISALLGKCGLSCLLCGTERSFAATVPMAAFGQQGKNASFLRRSETCGLWQHPTAR